MTHTSEHTARVGRVEFIVLMSLIMGLGALAIDSVLPAFGEIRAAFELGEGSTEAARVVTAFFLGSALQIVHGPLADRFGRRALLFGGMATYILGAVATILVPTFGLVLVARFVWGIGAAAMQVSALSMVRDRFSGDRMARAMSFIMGVFVVTPIVAPLIGAAILRVSNWQVVFVFPAVFAALVAVWALRLRETLPADRRLPLDLRRIGVAAGAVVRNRITVGFTLAMMLTFGGFTSYLASSELIIGRIYGRPELFPVVFAVAAAVMGLATFANGHAVTRWGGRSTLRIQLVVFIVGAFALTVFAVSSAGVPSFVPFISGLVIVLAIHTAMVPTYSALALEPMGAQAGTAAALFGTTYTAGGALIGSVIDARLGETVTALPFGLAVGGVGALILLQTLGRSPD